MLREIPKLQRAYGHIGILFPVENTNHCCPRNGNLRG